jgi:MFS transporter, ACS family, glucarate transporter
MVGPSPGSDGRSNVRWTMILLVLIVAAVSFLDRTNISIAGVYLKSDLNLSDVQLGVVFSAFGLGYALSQPLAGWVADRFGVYRTMAIGISWWSVLTAVVAVIPMKVTIAFTILLSIRFILGIGEALIFPASNRMVVNWLPSQERGLANGLIFAGVGVGAGIAPSFSKHVIPALQQSDVNRPSAAISPCETAAIHMPERRFNGCIRWL